MKKLNWNAAMKSRWSDAAVKSMIDAYAARGIDEDLAARVYTTRLLGQDPRLVLHGGGNTSVKTQMTDLLGDRLDVICVKGSGWDMGAIEPAGLPAVRLAPLRRLRALDTLSDEDMVNFQRVNLVDSDAVRARLVPAWDPGPRLRIHQGQRQPALQSEPRQLRLPDGLLLPAAAVLWNNYQHATTPILRQQLKWITRGTFCPPSLPSRFFTCFPISWE